jgi:hypothetical protein
MNMQTIPIRGTTTTADATPVRSVAIPLPADGAWCITGRVVATDTASGRSRSVAFSPVLSGYSAGGVPHENDGAQGAIPMAPATGFGVAGVGIAPVFSGQGPSAPVCELQFTGAAGVNIAWGWNLSVEALGL